MVTNKCVELNNKIEHNFNLIDDAYKKIRIIEEDISILYKQLNSDKKELNKLLKSLFKDEYIKFGKETGYLE